MIVASALMVAALSGTVPKSDQAWRTAPDPLFVQRVYNYAACAGERSPAGAKALLAMDFRTREYSAALRRFARGHAGCVPGGSLKFNSLIFAGSLAEKVLGRSPNLVAGLTTVAAGPPTVARSPQEATGICVARAEPAQTQALLATAPTSPEERQALARLIPAVTRCVATGQQARFNHSGLRALIALAAYRLVNPITGA